MAKLEPKRHWRWQSQLFSEQRTVQLGSTTRTEEAKRQRVLGRQKDLPRTKVQPRWIRFEPPQTIQRYFLTKPYRIQRHRVEFRHFWQQARARCWPEFEAPAATAHHERTRIHANHEHLGSRPAIHLKRRRPRPLSGVRADPVELRK